MPTWAETQHDQERFAIAVRRLLEAKHNLSNSTIEPINGTIVVAAAPEIHAEIVDMAAQLKALLGDFRAQQQEADQAAEARRLAAIERIREEFSKVRDSLVLVRKEKAKKQADLDAATAGAAEAKPDEATRAASERQARELRAQITSLELTEDELQTRYEHLQGELIEREYEQLTVPFATNAPVSSATAVDQPAGVIHIVGQVPRPGVYQHSPRMSLSRLLASSGAAPEAADTVVYLTRMGTTTEVGSVEEILTSEDLHIALYPDDMVRVAAAGD